MNLMQISVSSQEDELSIRISIKGAPLILQFGHPLLAFVSALSASDYAKALYYIDPLKIVDNPNNADTFLNYSPLEQDEEEGIIEDSLTNDEEDEKKESELANAIKEGLKYNAPEFCEEGVNGTYFMKNKEGHFIGVFKPIDEEGKGSPKKSKVDAAFGGIHDGEGALREVAAFLLDKEDFSGVPHTELIHIENFNENGSKSGSIQQYVENDGSAEDMGPKAFPAHEVHKIGVLDLRILNNDRHAGNILFRETDDRQIELIPIDHGLSFPATLEHVWFDWLSWPQAKQPFDEETKKYISEIDINQDAEILRNLGMREECIANMKISSMLLKKGCAAGLTLYDIGNIVSRIDLEEPSKLEEMIDQATEAANGESEQKEEILMKIMDDYLISL